ncbi:MAG: histidine triad nucleotide-binding protein [Ruminococcus sp.]
MSCIFCMLAKGEIPSTKVYEDDKIIAFNDINPQAPVHVVIIPKEHILTCANDITEENVDIVAYIFTKIPEIARLAGTGEGYRIVNNCGELGAQTVFHIHFHLLGGEKLSEKLN